MAKEIIAHHLTDWSKVDEKAGFWGRIDLLRPEINFGIHRYNDNLSDVILHSRYNYLQRR